jgi:IS5 family transposase
MMLRTVGDPPSLWESILPEGRPSIPMETYLRLMFLKHRCKLGYEPLCRAVADSIMWRRFCRIGLAGSVPHASTSMRITTRSGQRAVDELNEALIAKAVEAKRSRRWSDGAPAAKEG